MDGNLYTISAAFKASKEKDKINYVKLLKNIKRSLKMIEKDLDEQCTIEFRRNYLHCSLHCCPSLRSPSSAVKDPKVEQLQNVFPMMSNETFVRLSLGQSYYKLITPLVEKIPAGVSAELINILVDLIKKPTLDSLNLAAELTEGLIKNIDKDCNADQIKKGYEATLKYFEVFHTECCNEGKTNEAYLFLNSLNLLDSTLSISNCGIQAVDELKKTVLSDLLTFCNSIVISLDISKWSSWTDIVYTDAFTVLKHSIVFIQSEISYTAHSILQSLQSDSDSTITKNTALKSFLELVAVDPNHDTDEDLSFQELLDKLKNLNTEDSDSKMEKYLTKVFSPDHTSDLFQSDLYEFLAKKKVKESLVLCLFDRYVEVCTSDADTCKKISKDWKKTVIKLAGALDADSLKSFFLRLLTIRGLDTWLEYDEDTYLTEVCNSVVLEDNIQISKVLLGCLQNAFSTLKALISLAITRSGMVDVIATVLLNFANLELDGNTFLCSLFLDIEKQDGVWLSYERYRSIVFKVCGAEMSTADKLLRHYVSLSDEKTDGHWKMIQGLLERVDVASDLGDCFLTLIPQTCDFIRECTDTLKKPATVETEEEHEELFLALETAYDVLEIIVKNYRNCDDSFKSSLQDKLSLHFLPSICLATVHPLLPFPSEAAPSRCLKVAKVLCVHRTNAVKAMVVVRKYKLSEVTWIACLAKVLVFSPSHHWDSAFKLVKEADSVGKLCPLGSLQRHEMCYVVMSGVLELIRLIVESNSLSLYCYTRAYANFTNAMINMVHSSISDLKENKKVSYIRDTFLWWCHNRVSVDTSDLMSIPDRVDTRDLMSIPCVKLLDIFKEVTDSDEEIKRRSGCTIEELENQYKKHVPQTDVSKQIILLCHQILN